MLYCAVTSFCKVGCHSEKTREYGTAEKRKKEGCGKRLYLPLGQANMNFSLSNLAPPVITLLLTHKILQLFKLV